MIAQLPLAVRLRDSDTFANFISGPNLQLVELLQNLHPLNGQYIYLWGADGVGKSHLLQAICRQFSDRQQTNVYLPLSLANELSPEMLEGLESLALICVDDIDAIAGDPAWETALFHLYNRVKDAGHHLLMTASASPSAIGISLPDLRTRLGWGLVFQMQSLNDDGKLALLQRRAQSRGLVLPDEVARYLLMRSQRDMEALISLLERLDDASLAAQRRLTIPFVKEVLATE